MDTRHLDIQQEKYKRILRIRNTVFDLLQKYFRELGYVEVQIPVLTRSISSPGALSGRIASDVAPFRVDYFFGREMFLSQSSQLYLEALVKLFPKVFTNMPSFRNEASDTRHLNEFWHVEIEQANIDLDDILTVQEQMIRHLIQEMLEKHSEGIIYFTGEERLDELKMIEFPFPRITYKEALARLEKELDMPVSLEKSNTDLGHFSAAHEQALTKLYGGQPLFVTHYPTEEVAFYHAVKRGEEDVVLNADLLAPGYGEIIGSGERIVDPEELIAKIERFEMNRDDYEWYIDIKKGQTQPNSGFGMGIERFITWLLKLPSIEEAIAFPRVTTTHRP